MSFHNEDAKGADKHVEGRFINVDLDFHQEQYSILASAGFIVTFLLGSLIAGRTADNYNRATVLICATAAWSVFTASNALASTFLILLLIRLLTGLAQAFMAPQAYGLIAESFSGEGNATANAVYSSGVYLGGAIASLSILLDERFGWRQTFLIAGGIGLVVAVAAAFFLRDPREIRQVVLEKDEDKSRDADAHAWSMQQSLEAVKTVLSSRFILLLYLASAIRFLAGYGIGVWIAPFFREEYPGMAVSVVSVSTSVSVPVPVCLSA